MNEPARSDYSRSGGVIEGTPTLTSTVQQIEWLRHDIQNSVLDTMIAANRKFIDQQLRQSDFVVANEIACVLNQGLQLTAQIVSQLKQTGKNL